MTATRGVVQPQTDPVPLRICLRGDDSDGDLAVVEMVLDPGSGLRCICTRPTANLTDQPVRLLCAFAPAGQETRILGPP
jgi:hypothetical protein